ncbi:dihydrofolate reductase [Nocardioides mangrovicus]|uniref:Dihydrofolate reductase n=1 Tax=Nocardioides mangrovicus TaxID=2478913 RepID=A0A3L8P1G5_9ACTN|nr:2-hydroxyacid dehydrogenase [Nocardioides mangrovicus]RLV48994.1 dihydrofolate reductase [Nocardioides mangrovicus]
MSEPLVWLPFDPADLGDVPGGLRYEVQAELGGPDWQRPGTIDQVELVVPPYAMGDKAARTFPDMPRLRVVQTLSAGVDNVRPWIPEGVTLCNARGVHDASTAELAVALTLASLRGLPQFVRNQDRGRWRRHVGPALADKRVLVVGYGSIGRAIEARMLPFETEVVRVARTARPDDDVHGFDELADLLPEADVVVLVVPLTDQTQGLVDAGFLAAMKDGALLVNVARGPVVDTDALLAEGGRVAAALDVTDPEPLPDAHPLWSAPNVLVSPHVGGATSAMWPRAHRLVREQLERFAAGEDLLNVMSGEY